MTHNSSSNRIPLVSVGLPVYNGGERLRHAIDTLLAQEFTDFELIISDNASTDGTEALCRSYAARDARVRYVRRDRNYGMLNNGRNTLTLARGKYFVAAAHDDEWKPQYLGKCVERLEANPGLVLVCPDIEFFRPDGTIIDVPYPPIRTVGMGIREKIATIFHENNVGYNIFGVMRRDALLRVNTQVECFACDVVHLLQLLFLGDADHVPEKLFRFCFVKKTPQQHASNISEDLGVKRPTKLYTILTINLFRAIMNAAIPGALKRVLISDALEIIAVKNILWRQTILSENPGLLQFVDPGAHGALPSSESNLIAAFAALLLPYCYEGAPFDGAIDFSGSEGLDAIPESYRTRPAPGHREFNTTLSRLLERGMYSQALAYHDAYRDRQPTTTHLTALDTRIDAIHPWRRDAKAAQKMERDMARRLRIVLLDSGGACGGWDTFMRQQIEAQLLRRGHEALSIADDELPAADTDIVHAFCLTRSQALERQLNHALGNRIPLVITALLGDYRRYQVKAQRWFRIFERYINDGQKPETFEATRRLAVMESLTFPAPSVIAARYAARVLACGPTEASLITALCPSARTAIIPPGTSGRHNAVPKTVFEQKYGLTDIVLCIGDLTAVNNQLMLLKALEDEDLPVVLIDGGNAVDPDYAALCRRMRRKGPTIFVSNPSGELLLSAYHAARVFCLPAWDDLPGAMALEAAYQGCAVVASSWGCVGDYLGDRCVYCEPDSPESVHDAVLRAYTGGANLELQKRAATFTWGTATEKLEAIYHELTG